MTYHERLIDSLKESEGLVRHMYLDTRGFVTVGVGQMLPDAESAKHLPFINVATLEPATPEEIESDYQSVKNQPPGLRAALYEAHTKLALPLPDIEALLRRRIEEFEEGLREEFPDYDAYPEDAREGLFDMAYNLGLSGLVRKFPTFTAAAKRQDWATCARECHRQGIGEYRNRKTRELFERAAAA